MSTAPPRPDAPSTRTAPTRTAPTRTAPTGAAPIDRDVVVVGAGISGIDVAYRMTSAVPGLDLEIVEAREHLGGTWDLFRYPGIRSDSDIHTLAFPWRPWPAAYGIADGEQIREYLLDTARVTGLDERTTVGTRVTRAEWDSRTARWLVTCEGPDGTTTRRTRFLVAATGYYSYEHPYDPRLPGVEDFAGPVVHPQHWPADLDLSGQEVVVIGSGATAMSLVPALARRGVAVTMLQRTPTYVLAQPRKDALGARLDAVLGPRRAQRVVRAKNAAAAWAVVRLCLAAPGAARRVLRRGVVAATGSERVADEHFDPPYRPWEQRLCIVPDGDLFEEIRAGRVRVVTDHVERVEAHGVRTRGGELLPADVLVTATGLEVELAGGMDLVVDGEPVDLARTVTWNGAMLTGLPNLGIVIGYTNAAWTLRADLTAGLLTRVVRRLLREGRTASVVPVAPPDLEEGHPLMDMRSGYLARAAHLMPRATDRYPFAATQNVVVDGWHARRADLDDGLRWSRR